MKNKRKAGVAVIFIILFTSISLLLYFNFLDRSGNEYGLGSRGNAITIYMVRHGQTEANVQGLLVGGGMDSPMTETGKREVHRTGKALKEVNFTAAYSSELGRAVETRNIIVGENKSSKEIKTYERADFNDISWGKAEGLSMQEAVNEFGEKAMGDPFGDISDKKFISPIKAESKYEFYNRFNSGMDNIVSNEDYQGKNILVVAHSSMGYWLSKKFKNPDYNSLDNASVTIVQYKNGKWKMLDFNDNLEENN